MASLYDIKTGQDIELKRILANAGFTAEDVLRIIKQPTLAEAMHSAISESPVKHPGKLVTFDPFQSTDYQVRNVGIWNKAFGWGFTDEEYHRAMDLAPAWPKESMTVPVLVPYLDSAKETFDALWTVAKSRQMGYWECKIFTKPTNKTLRLISGITHPERCLRWEIIDLGANRNRYVADCSDPQTAAHAGVLAAAAQHPLWAQSALGDPVPHVAIAGYECQWAPDGSTNRKPWEMTPSLEFRKNEHLIALCGHDKNRAFESVAIPVIREIIG